MTNKMKRNATWGIFALSLIASQEVGAQVSAYTFSQSTGTWQPIAGNGTPLGMPGLPAPFTFDDNSFVTAGESIPLGDATTGNGWPIGFTFHYNGQAFDRVGLSMEGWLAFGNAATGPEAVYVPIGSNAYTPISSPAQPGVDPLRRNRVVGFATDLAAMGNGGTWPIQIRTTGIAPNRTFTAEYNVVRSGGSNLLRFQIKLNEGGGVASAQTVQVVYGSLVQTTTMTGQVGLSGSSPGDFNNRSVTEAPFNWAASVEGTVNTATCRLPAATENAPEGLTFTWTPPACGVNGVSVTDLTASSGNITGTLSWSATPGATSYSYIITAGSPSDPPVLSGNSISGTQVQLTGLPAGQQLFAFVRANCAPTDLWGAGMPFSTSGVVEVVCGEAPVEFTYCYSNFEQKSWVFHSSTGDPLRLLINAGIMGVGDEVVFYDGEDAQAPVIFTSASGPIAGQVVNSSGGAMTMRITADQLSACDNTEWLEPIQWEIGCMDCDPIQATYEVVDDCDNDRFSVAVQIFNLGTTTSASITNDGGAPTVAANTTGLYTVGPFANGTSVIVTVENADNEYCSSVSSAITNGTCPVVGCGPTTYSHCYTDNDAGKWAYEGDAPNDRVGIRFLSGSLALGDVINVFDGSDEFMSPVLGSASGVDLTGMIFTSSASSNTIMLQAVANGSASCATGSAQTWNYIVSCYDGCDAPEATFSVVDDCDAGRFNVLVQLTSLGSAGDVVITNNGGAPALTATVAGQHSVGPFNNGQQVVVSIEGASELCSLNSIALGSGCGVGIEEIADKRLAIYPDPGVGAFNVVLPRGFGGGIELEVLDLAGRRVLKERSMVLGDRSIPLDLQNVPTGSYVVVLRDQERTVTGTVRVMR